MGARRSVAVLVLALAGLALAGPLPADELGYVSLPECLVVGGSTAVSAQALRRALAEDPAVLSAAVPGGDPVGLEGVVAERVIEALRRRGHLDARCRTHFDAARQRLIVDVVAGPRAGLSCVEVRGARALSSELLTSAAREAMTASWGAAFGEADLRRAEEAVASRYRQAGHLDVAVHSSVEEGPRVVVVVDEEGPVAHLAAIEAVGATSLSTAEVAGWLELRPGTALTSTLLDDVTERLRACGRFVGPRVALRPGEGGGFVLTVVLRDVPGLPPPWEPLGEAGRAMLALRSALASLGPPGHGATVEVRLPGEGYDGTLALGDGRGPRVRVRRSGDRPLDLEADLGRSTLTLARHHAGWTGSSPAPGSGASFVLSVGAAPEGSEEPFTANASMTWSSASAADTLAVTMTLDPAPFLSLAADPATTCTSLPGGGLVVRAPRGGGVLEVTLSADGGLGGLRVLGADGDVLGRVTPSRDDGLLPGEDSSPGRNPSAVETLTSFLVGLLAEDLELGTPAASPGRAVLLRDGLILPIARAWESLPGEDLTSQSADEPLLPRPPLSGPMAAVRAVAVLLAGAEGSIPEATWPRILGRLAAAVAVGDMQGAAALAGVLDAAPAGPVARLIQSHLVGLVNPALGGRLARRGVEEARARGLVVDAALVLACPPLRSALEALRRTLSGADPAVVDALASLLPGEESGVLRSALGMVGQSADMSLDAAVGKLIESEPASRFTSSVEAVLLERGAVPTGGR